MAICSASKIQKCFHSRFGFIQTIVRKKNKKKV